MGPDTLVGDDHQRRISLVVQRHAMPQSIRRIAGEHHDRIGGLNGLADSQKGPDARHPQRYRGENDQHARDAKGDETGSATKWKRAGSGTPIGDLVVRCAHEG